MENNKVMDQVLVNENKYRRQQKEYMRKYREEHPEQLKKMREYMKERRIREITEGDIMQEYIEQLIVAPDRTAFAKVCVLALDELGYDTGELWNKVM